MSRYLLMMLALVVVFIAGCTSDVEVNDFESCADAGNAVRESYPRQCEANGNVYVEEINQEIPEETHPEEGNAAGGSGGTRLNNEEYCGSLGGIWVEGYDECEYISIEDCEAIDGTFNECESACRHNVNEDTVCTMQCIPVCRFG